MKLLISLIWVGLLLLAGSIHVNLSTDPADHDDAEKYVIRIESSQPGQEVKFKASYVFGTEDMEVIEEETPHVLISSSPRLNVIIQGESADTDLEAYFHESISGEEPSYRLSGSGRTIIFGTQWTRRADNEMEENHYVTVR